MIVATLLALLSSAQDVEVVYSNAVPGMYIEGEPFLVTVTASAEAQKVVTIPTWALTPSAFDLDGIPLGEREEVFLSLVPGQKVSTTFDLGRQIADSEAFQDRDFKLRFAGHKAHLDQMVAYLKAAEKGIEFMTLPQEQLQDYDVVLLTMHGPVWLQLWPGVAPQHCRNFLDLAYSGFYDDTIFHRAIPGFMIQGGGEKPGRPAPRRVRNEFNDRRHVPGVLSMARLGVDTRDEKGELIPQFDSATCEFFLMHAVYPSLDGKYTGFGKIVTGMNVVEKVIDSVKDTYHPRDVRTHKPKQPQKILKAVVVKAPKRRPLEDD